VSFASVFVSALALVVVLELMFELMLELVLVVVVVVLVLLLVVRGVLPLDLPARLLLVPSRRRAVPAPGLAMLCRVQMSTTAERQARGARRSYSLICTPHTPHQRVCLTLIFLCFLSERSFAPRLRLLSGGRHRLGFSRKCLAGTLASCSSRRVI